MKILITPRALTAQTLEDIPELEPLQKRGWTLIAGPAGTLPTASDLATLLPGVHGWLCGIETVDATTLSYADQLRIIARNGVGADGIDTVAARERNIAVQLAHGANANGVAELALALILSALRNIPNSNTSLHGGEWTRKMGKELADCTVGIVGYGSIGKIVARLVSAFGARVLISDPYLDARVAGAENLTLPELFSRSNVVTLHAPASPGGAPLVTSALIDLLPVGAVLVNTARSSLIDPVAVHAALETEKLGAYAVDAFDQEPPVPNPLLSHPRTIMTPHLGGYTESSIRRATDQAVAAIISHLGE